MLNPAAPAPVLTIPELFGGLRRFWWAPLIAAVLGGVLGFVYLHWATPMYTAQAILGPRQTLLPSQRGGGLGIGGLLATLQGGPQNAQLARADIIWKSERLAAAVAESEELTRLLFPDRWNEESGTWRPSGSLRARLDRLVGIERPDRPGPEDVHDRLSARMSAAIELQTFRTLRLRARSPEAAEALLAAIIGLTNSEYRQDDLADVDAMLAYSAERIATVDVPRQNEALATLVLALEQQKLQIEAARFHMFDVIQPPIAERVPTSPNTLLVMSAAILLPPVIVVGGFLLWPAGARRRIDKQAGGIA